MSSSDRSRTSDDRRYHYKAVVAQQGRVIVDRDLNALETILNQRADTDVIDIVGPVGTPDNGFEISAPTPLPSGNAGGSPSADFSIGPGTMYVGGQRVEFPALVDGTAESYSYFAQPDWLRPSDPVAVTPATNIELVWLDVFDQEVSATEDTDLKEIALGGPDTTARVRLMRRVRRTSAADDSCVSAWADVTGRWLSNDGLVFDPDTMRLQPQARLQVAFEQDPAATDPCDPIARGGYLYSENQLIRIQIGRRPGAGRPPTSFLWGYDNASFLYRVSSLTNGGTQIQLADSPPDAFHWPKKGQIIEILRTAVVLGAAPDLNDPSATIERCVAEASGEIRTLTNSYGASTQGGTVNYLSFSGALPADYQDDANPLFVRIWQSQQDLASAASGTPLTDGVDNSANGVVVTLTGAVMTPGAFWMIALRPATPQAVYPERFLHTPQPPDGPARWACPLATIDWNTTPPTVSDCRSTFDNLVALSRRKPGCCSISVRPQDLNQDKSLQAIIDTAVTQFTQVKICFDPGTYLLTRALQLDARHAGLVLEACIGGAILKAAPDAKPQEFAGGLIVMTNAPDVTLSGLTFASAAAPLTGGVAKELRSFAQYVAAEANGFKRSFNDTAGYMRTPLFGNPEEILVQALNALYIRVAVRSVWCTGLSVHNCTFEIGIPQDAKHEHNLLSLGLFAQGDCTGLSVQGSGFTGNTRIATNGLVGNDLAAFGLVMAATKPSAPTNVSVKAVDTPVTETAATPVKKKTAKKKSATAALSTAAALAIDRVEENPEEQLAQLPDHVDASGEIDATESFRFIDVSVGILIEPWVQEINRDTDDRSLLDVEFGLQTTLGNARISTNTFDGLTMAITCLAESGRVNISENIVTRCTSGIWYAAWNRALMQFDIVEPLNQGADLLLYCSLLCVETFVGMYVGMFMPLPAAYNKAGPIPPASPPLVPIVPAFTFFGNRVDCTADALQDAKAAGSFALATFSDRTEALEAIQLLAGAMAIGGNELRGTPPTQYPVAFVGVDANLTMTGNIVTNLRTETVPGSLSLLVDINATFTTQDEPLFVPMAVTGNVFYGLTNLKLLRRRAVPAVIDTWDVFNDVIT